MSEVGSWKGGKEDGKCVPGPLSHVSVNAIIPASPPEVRIIHPSTPPEFREVGCVNDRSLSTPLGVSCTAPHRNIAAVCARLD